MPTSTLPVDDDPLISPPYGGILLEAQNAPEGYRPCSFCGPFCLVISDKDLRLEKGPFSSEELLSSRCTVLVQYYAIQGRGTVLGQPVFRVYFLYLEKGGRVGYFRELLIRILHA